MCFFEDGYQLKSLQRQSNQLCLYALELLCWGSAGLEPIGISSYQDWVGAMKGLRILVS